ncbi:MAG: histidinol dehydrogenase [Francisellaceae bacterium]
MRVIDYNKVEPDLQTSLLQRPLEQSRENRRQVVKNMIDDVRLRKDKALKDYTRQLDGVWLDRISVEKSEINKAYGEVDDNKISLIEQIVQRISAHHRVFKPSDKWIEEGRAIRCGKIYRPIHSVGLYVPGGFTPLISTVMMLAVPAKIAGCSHVAISTPVDRAGRIHPLILVAADLCDVDVIYKLGGAQAIAAMAYGSESVQKVDKVYGPGNSWVTEAKLMVSQDPNAAAIDLPAGPSEVVVIADKNADAALVAADLLAQAEHGADSQVMLMTDSKMLAEEVVVEIDKQKSSLSRRAIIEMSLSHSLILVVDNIDQAIKLSNRYGPEHLILQVDHAESYISRIQAAGAVFIGAWSPETLGDYVTGSNHVLPTGGYARNSSGLTTADFMTAISVQQMEKSGFEALADMAMAMAEIEGLEAHKNAVAIRIKRSRFSAETVL